MMMGIETTPAATASAVMGVLKKKANRGGIGGCKRSTSFPRQAMCQVARQGNPQRGVRAQPDVVDVQIPAAAFDLLQKRVHLVEIALPQSAGIGQQGRILLEPLEQGRLLKRKVEFRPVQDVQNNDLVP